MSKPSYGQKAYDRGYADAMNWKVQNHLEHFEPRTWVGLTEDEISKLVYSCDYDEYEELVRATEAKLKEKNHG